MSSKEKAERNSVLANDALSLELVLRDYTDEERRFVMKKLDSFFCQYCWRKLDNAATCECAFKVLELLELVHENEGLRFEVCRVGPMLTLVASRFCKCDARVREVLHEAQRFTYEEINLRPLNFSRVLLDLMRRLLVAETEHKHEKENATTKGLRVRQEKT